MPRSDPPTPEWPGYHFVPAKARHWRLHDRGRTCRFPRCSAPAVADLNRRPQRERPLWYGYCETHAWGRWVDDGQVWEWVLVPTDEWTEEWTI